MKKVIGIQQFEPIQQEKLLLYQQIEYLTYWLYDIQQNNNSNTNDPPATMDQLIEIKRNLQLRKNNQLEDIKKELTHLKAELINYSQLFGIDSIERLLLAEIGIVAAKEFNENCIETLIFLNQIIQPISYEKKRFSPRSEFEEPDHCINELCIDNHVWVAYEPENPLNLTVWIRYEDQLIQIKGQSKRHIDCVDMPELIEKKYKEKRHHINNFKYPKNDSEQTEGNQKNKRRKGKEKTIASEFREKLIQIIPTFKLLLSTDDELEETLIETHKLWLTISEKIPNTTITFNLDNENGLKRKLEKLTNDIQNLITFYNQQPTKQSLILDLLCAHNKQSEAVMLYMSGTKNHHKLNLNEDTKAFLTNAKRQAELDDKTTMKYFQLDQHFNNVKQYYEDIDQAWLEHEFNGLNMSGEDNDTHHKKRMERMETILSIPMNKASTTLQQISFKSPLQKRQQFETQLNESLNKALHGQENAKKAIIQIVGQLIANKTAQPKPLLLVGPPGTGKTSLATGLANALGKGMGLISLGGEPDKHLLKGCDIVYESPSIGEIASHLIKTKQMDPIIVLDEVDKMGDGRDGKATHHQVMELTDASITSWVDNYCRIQIPKQKIWFVLTANDISKIDPVLLDRVQVIHVGSQSKKDKTAIATHHIIPKLTKEFKFPQSSLVFSHELIELIIDTIPYEPGCRQLANAFRKIISDINLKRFRSEQVASLVMTGSTENDAFRLPYSVTEDDIITAIDRQQNPRETIQEMPQIGCINGLYATTNGHGGILPIQVVACDKLTSDIVTGQCGDIMKESIKVARTLNLNTTLIDTNDNSLQNLTPYIHLHAPDMGVEKDGPSAGTAITLAVLSAIRNIPIKPDVAVTGEIDIQGNILPVGGIYEKVSGAVRAGATTIIVPLKNKKDIEKTFNKDPDLKSKVTIILADKIQDILANVLILD